MREIALFDLDETIISCKSMLEVMRHYYINEAESVVQGQRRYQDLLDDLAIYDRYVSYDRQALNRYFYQKFQGINVESMQAICVEWFQQKGISLLNDSVFAAMQHHQENNREIIIVSGSFTQCVQPIAEFLNISQLICAELLINEGLFTGELLNDPVIGNGKSQAILQRFQDDYSINLNGSFAYGDHISDLPMLTLVGNPVIVGNCPYLNKYAAVNGWEVLGESDVCNA